MKSLPEKMIKATLKRHDEAQIEYVTFCEMNSDVDSSTSPEMARRLKTLSNEVMRCREILVKHNVAYCDMIFDGMYKLGHYSYELGHLSRDAKMKALDHPRFWSRDHRFMVTLCGGESIDGLAVRRGHRSDTHVGVKFDADGDFHLIPVDDIVSIEVITYMKKKDDA